jgi:FkbM family methyltransferase
MRLVDGWWIHDRRWRESPIQDPVLAAAQIDTALKYCRQRRFAVQAGARIGLWPKLLAARFENVLAFEPEAENFACAERNLRGVDNVLLVRAALGAFSGIVNLERSNASDGLHHVVPKRTATSCAVFMDALDSYELEACDALYLDVEGYEPEVLDGARQTIERHHPVLVLEENSLCHRYGRQRGDLAKYLALLGYTLAEEFGTLPPKLQSKGFRGADLVFVHEAA